MKGYIMSNIEKIPGINEIEKAIAVHRSIAFEYKRFGACDSEPYWVFENMVQDTLRGGKGKLPISCADWQLYSTMATGPAVREMTKSAKVVRDLFKKHRKNTDVYNYYIDY